MAREDHIKIFGRVQGVGFRFFVEDRAVELGIQGYVRNCADGSVEVVAQGKPEILEIFTQHLRQGPAGSWVERVEISHPPLTQEYKQFSIHG